MSASMTNILQSVIDSTSLDEGERLYIPIPPRDFFLSEYHCGFTRRMIPDFWLEEAVDFIDGGYSEIIITGSLGSFKTTWANLIILYKMYELFSYKSIHTYFDIPKVQDIYNIYFNVNLTQARLTGFNQLKNMVDSSQWFTKQFPRNTHLNSMIEFQKQPCFKFFSGSGTQHAIGMTLWCFALDEGDFFKKNGSGFDESYSYVTNLYTELVDRRVSRFKKKERDFSFSILISSATFQSSFVEKRIEDALTDPAIKVVKAITYEVAPERYSKEKFLVFGGDGLVDPEMVGTVDDLNNVLAKLRINTKLSGVDPILECSKLPAEVRMKFVLPPVDLKQRFERNLGKSLQNFCGIFIAAEGKLFQTKGLLFNAYRPELVHPFSKQQIEISNADTVMLQDYFMPHTLTDKSKPHALHIDGSLSGDSTGISMVRYDGLSGTIRHYTQVFSLEITPPQLPNKIKLSKIRDFVIYLYKTVGVNIVMVSQDQYQSADSLQLMKDAGVETRLLSIDRSDQPYLAWIGMLVDNAIGMYKYQILENEAFAAIHDRRKRKVDHPRVGNVNINVLQSFVGALWNLVQLDGDKLGYEYNVSFPSLNAKEELMREVIGNPIFVEGPLDLIRMKKSKSMFDIIFDA